MPTALYLTFPAGRYHATSWGHHVNEAVPDWPPAPFRVLRALYAQAYRMADRPPEDLLRRLFTRLSRPPAYRMPAHTTGHTRHYVPGKGGARVLILDAFVAVHPAEPLVVQWDVDLAPDELALLERLAASLTWFGRADAWCDARVGPAVEGAIGPGEGEGEPVPLLAIARDCPDVLAALDARTDLLRKARAQDPEGTMWVTYFAPAPARPSRIRPVRVPRPTAALFQLDAGARPRILDAVEVAHHFHRALLAVRKGESPVLSGRKGGRARASGHAHCHYLPFDLDGDGWITHLLAWADEGFEGPDLDAMGRLSSVRRPRDEALEVRLLDTGAIADFRRLPVLSARGARRWRSHTPFLLNRHPKRRAGGWVDTPEDQLRRELRHRDLPVPVNILRLHAPELKGRRPRWLEFRRWRGRRTPALPSGYGFRVELSAPVFGPLCLGFGAHFGLGLFVPDEDR